MTKKRIVHRIAYLILFFSFAANTIAASFDLPMRIPPLLSGNFGEFRSNHFHSGIDFKTGGSIGKPIYAPADGWISRIRVGAGGFGLALYLDHPEGYTTVYGHLDRFSPSVDQWVQDQQYRREQFDLDTMLVSGLFPVKRGERIATSGNSGSSGGPHLHFEIRSSPNQIPIDPLIWFRNQIKDQQPPNIRGLRLYAFEGKGTILGSKKQSSHSVVRVGNGHWRIQGNPPQAWGLLGLGIKAYDAMDGTHNIYGVQTVELYRDSTCIYRHQLDSFSFDETRYINAMKDYPDWVENRSMYMKSFIEPGNRSPVTDRTLQSGQFWIEEEGTHAFYYILRDRHGNQSRLDFEITGKKMPIPAVEIAGLPMAYDRPNRFGAEGIQLYIPSGSFYNDLRFIYSKEASDPEYLSEWHDLHHFNTPLHRAMRISIQLKQDHHPNKAQYYMVYSTGKGKPNYVGGSYQAGWITAESNRLGRFAVALDTNPPTISPIAIENAVKNRLFRINISDKESGIRSWRATIDGQWVLMEPNASLSRLTYRFDPNRLERNKVHEMQLEVTDRCGNRSNWSHSFYY